VEDRPECVQRLADLLGVPGRVAERYEWDVVEASLGGLTLPRDYKAFVETFPRYEIGGRITVIRPGDVDSLRTEYLGYYAYRLEDMRGWRAKGQGRFPYPIFPEPGGVLPWGESNQGQLYFRLTGGADPDSWPVVWTDHYDEERQQFPGTMCEFLLNVAAGETPAAPSPPLADPGAGAGLPRWGRRLPENEFPLVSRVLGPNYPKAGPHDWAGFEADLGLSLPSDYRDFVDRYGAGTFCDIRIAGPDAGSEFDLRALLRRQLELAQSTPRARFAFASRARTAILGWGETADGWICGWGAGDADPNGWGVAMVSPDFQPVYYDELSFTSFLLHYCGERDQLGVSFGRTPWSGGPTFTPHRPHP
jgi:hypothetical protein